MAISCCCLSCSSSTAARFCCSSSSCSLALSPNWCWPCVGRGGGRRFLPLLRAQSGAAQNNAGLHGVTLQPLQQLLSAPVHGCSDASQAVAELRGSPTRVIPRTRSRRRRRLRPLRRHLAALKPPEGRTHGAHGTYSQSGCFPAHRAARRARTANQGAAPPPSCPHARPAQPIALLLQTWSRPPTREMGRTYSQSGPDPAPLRLGTHSQS